MATVKVSKITGNEFVRFKVPSNLNHASGEKRLKMLLRMAKKIDQESMAFVGVALSGLVITPHLFQLDGFYFNDSNKRMCVCYGVDTEQATGFSLLIARLTDANVKKAMKTDKPTLAAPVVYTGE